MHSGRLCHPITKIGTAAAAGASRHDHVCLLYEDESFLVDSVAPYLVHGLNGGQAVVVVATAAHNEQFRQKLVVLGHDVVASEAQGRLVMLDAVHVLEAISVDGVPHWEAFDRHVGDLIRRLLGSQAYTGVRTYGEMVDLLWLSGRWEVATLLEGLWERLAAMVPFSLLCAYRRLSVVDQGIGIASEDLEPLFSV